MVITAVQIADGHILEKLCRILSDRRIRGHQRQICVHRRRLFIVIPCSNLRDILDFIPVPVCNQTYLGVYLIIFETVDHAAAGFFHTFGPIDVVLLVEPCPQLYQYRDVLSVLGSRAEILHQSCFLRKTIDRNLNRYNVRINGRFLYHLQKRIHTLVRIVQQYILPLHLTHHVAVLNMR